MIYTKIRQERLLRHKNLVNKLDALRKRKFQILDSYGLKAYDYSKIKVTVGNGHKLTDQEKAAIAVEKIDKEIKHLESIVIPEQQEFEQQINRLYEFTTDWRHPDILKRLYIDGENMKDIIMLYFGEDSKNSRNSVDRIRNSAIKLLEKVSDKPFIEIQQTVLEDWSSD